MFVFDPYIKSQRIPDAQYVAMERSVFSESDGFVKENGRVVQLTNALGRAELQESIRLTELEKKDLTAIFGNRITLKQLLHFMDEIERDWPKIAIAVGMEDCIYSIQSNSSLNSDCNKCLEFLNKLFQRNYQLMTVSYILKLMADLYGNNLRVIKAVMQSLGLIAFWNKLHEVLIFVDALKAT